MLDLSTKRAAPLAEAIQMAGDATLVPAPAATRFILRGAAAVDAVGKAFGVALPTRPCRAESSGDHAALWLGPDEWLLLAPVAETETLQATLNQAVAGIACAVVDISHRQTAVLLQGAGATAILNAGTPLDLSLTAFPVGMAVRTIFEKAEIVLWRNGETSFHIEVWRSFAPYVVALLKAARDDEAAASALN
ncbi:sarcosine oxidase subunit gamma family protein [Devosia sp.]|uniref:sarcosine oxidase subunit gamma n=1 Tax=Devosia sp. TaxID=1871048 RepID=UPI003263D326